VTGWLGSPNKPWPGIYANPVWPAKQPSRRARHEAVVEAEGGAEELRPRPRRLGAPEQRNRGREGMSLEWTWVPHERGPQIYGVTKSYEYGARRRARLQTTVTAVSANRHRIEGSEVQLQGPSVGKEEEP
jgi:hypothetical protein